MIDQGVASLKIEADEIYRIGETVVDIGEFAALAENGMVMARGNYMTIWKREDGRWKVHRDISNF